MNFKSLPEQKQFKKGKFIRPGVQNLILRDITIQTSSNTGNQRPVFSMETEPVTEPGWEGHEGALGQIGNVAGNAGYYLKNNDQIEDFMGNLRDILVATDKFDAFMADNSNTDLKDLTDIVNIVKPFLVGTKARYFVTGEQYQKLDGTGVGLRLKLPNRKLVEPFGSDSKFDVFDESNPKHFKKLDKRTDTAQIETLPF